MITILAIADIDDFTWTYGSGSADILVSCGDVCDTVILQAADAFSCQTAFAVKGNHDTTAPFSEPITDLHLNTAKAEGLLFGGFNGSWKYKPRGNFLYEQAEANALLSGFPPVDIFISHNSPRNIHDRDDHVHHGFESLNTYIQRAEPHLLVHGHQHVDTETTVNSTQVVSVFGMKTITITL